MIEVNLIPPELRKKRKKQTLSGGFKIPPEIVVGSAGGLIAVLLVIHIFLLFLNLSRLAEHKNLKSQLEELAPMKQQVEAVLQEMRTLQSRLKAVTDVPLLTQELWSEKLNVVSDSLPKGVWLKKIALTDEKIFIEGSAISRESREMTEVHSFMANLKDNEAFLKNLFNVELSSIQSRKMNKIDISDFLITAGVK